MKKILTVPSVLATALIVLLFAAALVLLPRPLLAILAALLFLGFTGLYLSARFATKVYASYRTDDDDVKRLIALNMLDSTGYGYVEVLKETHTAASFTDGGSSVGTKSFTGYVPKGALLLGSKVVPTAGFAGDVSAALIIGDGSDTDRYNTSTVDIFTTVAAGVQSGVPSGNKLLTAANKPTLTVTTNADFTPVLAGGGSVTISIFYIRTEG